MNGFPDSTMAPIHIAIGELPFPCSGSKYPFVFPSKGEFSGIHWSEGTSPPPVSNVIGFSDFSVYLSHTLSGIPWSVNDLTDMIGRPAPLSLIYSSL